MTAVQSARVEMTTRPYTENDYELIASWWRARERNVPPKDALSSLGVIVETDRPIAGTWIYLSNSKLVNIGFTVTAHDIGPKARIESVRLAIDTAWQLAKSMGYKYAEAFSDSSALTEIFKFAGFTELTQHTFLFAGPA